MRLIPVLLFALILGGALFVWQSGLFAELTAYAAGRQREAQTALARAIQAARAGDAWAAFAVIGAAFTYGLAHAAGPGHGKAVIGSAALASRARAARLSLIALAGSIGQSMTAILLVYGGFLLAAFSARAAGQAADRWLTPLSWGLIAAAGLWLVWRGLHSLWRGAEEHDHDHHHSHGPQLHQIDGLGLGGSLALAAGIAVRPCSGTILLLAISWQAGLALLGLAGAFAIGLGTGLFTAAVAWAAVLFRDRAGQAARAAGLGILMALVQVLAGASIITLALVMLAAGRPLA